MLAIRLRHDDKPQLVSDDVVERIACVQRRIRVGKLRVPVVSNAGKIIAEDIISQPFVHRRDQVSDDGGIQKWRFEVRIRNRGRCERIRSPPVLRVVLLVAENVSGSPCGEVAVAGMINDLPAGMLALGIGSIVGAPKMENGTADKQATLQQKQR